MNTTNLNLTPPYHAITSLNLTELDIFSQAPFSELIQQNQKSNRESFLAVAKDELGKFFLANGYHFLEYLNSETKKQKPLRNPTNRAVIIDYAFYRFNKIKNTFAKFCEAFEHQETILLNFHKSKIYLSNENLSLTEQAAYNYKIGNIYILGHGKKRKFEKAFSYFLKAAELGHYLAQVKVAIHFECGKGTASNQEKAVYWRLEAAKSVHAKPDVFLLLALAYEHGTGVGKDTEEAQKYYQLIIDKCITQEQRNSLAYFAALERRKTN